MATVTSPALKEIQGLSNQQGLDIAGLVKQLGDSTKTINGLLNGNVEGAAATAQAIKEQTDATIASGVATDQLRKRNQIIAGMDPADLNNEYQQAFNALNASQAEYKTQKAQYDSLNNVGLLDNPIGYIFNQLQLPTVANRVNSAVDAIDAAQGNLSARQELLSRQNSIVVADTIDSDTKALRAKSQIALAEAADKASKAQVGDLQAIAQLQSTAISATNTVYDNKIKALQVQIAADEAAGNRALRSRQMAEMDDLKKARLEKLRGDMAAEADFGSKLLTVGKVLGYTVDLTPKVYATLTPKTKQAIDNVMLNGKFGGDLPEALVTLNNIPGSGIIGEKNVGLKQVLAQIDEHTNSAVGQMGKAIPGTPGFVPTKERPIVALQKLEESIKQSTTNPNSPTISSSNVWDSTPNPTLVNPLLMSSVPLPNNSLAKAFQTALDLKGPGKELTKKEEQLAYGAVRQQVIEGKLTVDQAVNDIVQYTSLGIAKSADTYQYSMLGIPQPNAYYTEWESKGMFGKKITVNMLNPASVKNAFVKDVRGFNALVESPVGEFFGVSAEDKAALARQDKLKGAK